MKMRIAVYVVAAFLVSAESAADSSNRYVNDGVLISRSDPTLAIDVNDSFAYAGRHPIRIRDLAAGERFVYVDADDREIRRMLIMQFEGFLPGVDGHYRYDLSESPVVANYPFRSNPYAFDLQRSIDANPGGESADTNEFLTNLGYRVPRQWMMWRSLTIADTARKKELILFYVEDLASTGLDISAVYENDEPTRAWVALQPGLEMRANQSFRLTGLDDEGRPLESGWTAIPTGKK